MNRSVRSARRRGGWRGGVAGVVLVVVTAAASRSSAPLRVGVLPFVDATGSGSTGAGPAIGRTIKSEIDLDGTYTARVLSPGDENPNELDGEVAVAIGRQRGVDLVLTGSVVEAVTKESSKGGWLPRIKGQQLNVKVRSVEARVTLQGELYGAATGERLAVLRVTGTHVDRKYQGTVWSTLGSWDVGNDAAFLASPLGRALQHAAAELATRIAGTPRPAGGAQ